jgi:hypothetical protein
MAKTQGPFYRASNLEAVIREQGRRFDWVAAQAGISKSHLTMICGGKRGASEGVAGRIAATLNTPLFLLFDLSHENETCSGVKAA